VPELDVTKNSKNGIEKRKAPQKWGPHQFWKVKRGAKIQLPIQPARETT